VIRTDVTSLLLFPVATACLALFSTARLYRSILRESPGAPQMSAIAGYIQEGARAFMKREVRTVAYFIVVLAVLLYVLLGWETSLGFVIGACLSVLAMIIGMNAATKANVRTVNAARSSAEKALKLAFRGGGIMGLAIVSLNILGILFLYFIFGVSPENQEAIYFLVGFGFGASLAALFAQLGGGIYTKAADVGADLAGKLEIKIPEDDPLKDTAELSLHILIKLLNIVSITLLSILIALNL
jgi:K(+)-stimulated pyrophosphate-energized sodium pump